MLRGLARIFIGNNIDDIVNLGKNYYIDGACVCGEMFARGVVEAVFACKKRIFPKFERLSDLRTSSSSENTFKYRQFTFIAFPLNLLQAGLCCARLRMCHKYLKFAKHGNIPTSLFVAADFSSELNNI